MIADLHRLCARRDGAGRLAPDPDDLLAMPLPESGQRYRRMHEDVITGPAPFAQIAARRETLPWRTGTRGARPGNPGAPPGQHFMPFFRDRATVENFDLGFTGITAANVQATPQRMIGSLGALDPMRTFAGIRCPALLVHAELDPIPVEWTNALVDVVPGADFVLLEGASHFVHVEDATFLADEVLPWLTKPPNTPAERQLHGVVITVEPSPEPLGRPRQTIEAHPVGQPDNRLEHAARSHRKPDDMAVSRCAILVGPVEKLDQ